MGQVIEFPKQRTTPPKRKGWTTASERWWLVPGDARCDSCGHEVASFAYCHALQQRRCQVCCEREGIHPTPSKRWLAMHPPTPKARRARAKRKREPKRPPRIVETRFSTTAYIDSNWSPEEWDIIEAAMSKFAFPEERRSRM
jgi:hypothetical protein